MTQIKAHFDGRAVILDEPADLVVGQTVRVIVDAALPHAAPSDVANGPWSGKFRMVDERDDVATTDFKDYLP